MWLFVRKSVRKRTVPSREAIEVSPEFVVEARLNSFVVVRFFKPTKYLIVNSKFLAMLPALMLRRRRRSRWRVARPTPTAFVVIFLHHHLIWTTKYDQTNRSEKRTWRLFFIKIKKNKKICDFIFVIVFCVCLLVSFLLWWWFTWTELVYRDGSRFEERFRILLNWKHILFFF